MPAPRIRTAKVDHTTSDFNIPHLDRGRLDRGSGGIQALECIAAGILFLHKCDGLLPALWGGGYARPAQYSERTHLAASQRTTFLRAALRYPKSLPNVWRFIQHSVYVYLEEL